MALSMVAPSHALDLLAYGNNYDGAATVGAAITVNALANGNLAPVTGGPYAAPNGKIWGGSFFLNESGGNPAAESVLTLGNLPNHTGVNIDFILGLLNSWDSRDGSCCSPDNLDIYVDNVLLHSYTTHNALGSLDDFGGATLLLRGGQVGSSDYYSDTLLDMATESRLTFAHSASTLTLKIQASGIGWQGGGDESWGVDDLSVRLTGVTAPVPEPSTAAMLLAGVCLLGSFARRQQRIQRSESHAATRGRR